MNSALAFVIEWGGLLLLLAIVLSPFFIIRLPRFRPTKWRYIVGAYLGSFLILIVLFLIFNRINSLIVNNLFRTKQLIDAYDNAVLKAFLLPIFLLPLLCFYSIKLVKQKLQLKEFLYATGSAIVLFFVLLFIFVFIIGYGLGQIGAEYF